MFIGDGWIDFPKIGKVKTIIHRSCEGLVKNVIVTKTKSGRFFASVQADENNPEPKFDRVDVSAPVDMGLQDFVVTSDGAKIAWPLHVQSAQKRLAQLQRRLSHKQKGSNSREKARLAVARQSEHVAHQRSDFLHKTGSCLVKTYGLIGIEDLKVSGMVKNHKLAKSISVRSLGRVQTPTALQRALVRLECGGY